MGSSPFRSHHTQSGFVLLIVLWALAIMALIDAAITSGSRTNLKLAEELRAVAYAESAADGGVAEAIFRLQNKQWAVNATYAIKIGAARLNIELRDEATKVNPNRASWSVLKLLLISVGVDEATSTRIAKSIVDYRNRTTTSLLGGQSIAQYRDAGLTYGPSNRPFESLDEIGLVIGVTPDLLARIEPHLTIYQEGSTQQNGEDMMNGSSSNDVTTASRYAPSAFGDASEVIKVVAAASLPGRIRFVREAIVRFKVRHARGENPYQILIWETP